MTPEQLAQLNELIEWKKQKESQQLSLPVDDASKVALGALFSFDENAANNSTLNLTGNAQTITVTVASKTIQVKMSNGQIYNVLCQ